ncbi:MAG: arylsulfatase [Nitrospira sp.]
MTLPIRVLTIVLLWSCLDPGQMADAGSERTNILMIVTDDMAFSDWGTFGGEIRTPHIDALAKEGIRMADYYVSPTCSPTRAMLMTGIDHHMVGLGTMAELLRPNQLGRPGYEGYLNDRAVTLSELLRDAGYATMIAGKWHLGDGLEQDPSRKGFEQSFVLHAGGASHFGDEWMLYPNYTPVYRQNGQRVHLPPGFYSSNFYTDQIIEWLKAKRDDQPFFAYLAFTAPHDPLHVPKDRLSDYKGVYDAGYGALSERRMARMKALGIIPSQTVAAPRPAFVPGWADLVPAEQERQARAMEIYAAMVGIIDDNVGRLVNTLKARGEYEDTLIVIFSDNGANGHTMMAYPGVTEAWLERNSDNRPENVGDRGSRISTGPGWALAGMTPFRMFKTFITEGGMRSPLIVKGPGVARIGEISHVMTDVRDIMPTLLDYAGVSHPRTYQGRTVLAMQGKSMRPFLRAETERVHDADRVFGFELFGWRGVRQGPWKATWIGPPVGPDDWQLFNLDEDPGETRDLARERPERLTKLKDLWQHYADEVGLVLPDKPSFTPE